MTVQAHNANAQDARKAESTTPMSDAKISPPRRKASRWAFATVIVILAGCGVFLATNAKSRDWLKEGGQSAWNSVFGHSDHHGTTEPHPSGVSAAHSAWHGFVEIDAAQTKTIGLSLVAARVQTEAMQIDVTGKTDYDPNTLNKIRPKFKSLIDKVYVEYGETVKAGAPLVDLFSADLAEAKGLYENKMAQWEHDRAELARSAELRKSGAESEKIYLSVLNDEKISGTGAKIAKDKLMVFGLSEAEIAEVAKEDGTKKAKMTLRAPASGVVIGRDVVKGNLYDENDVLLTIASLDHFWVYGFVYPSDASRVSLGQRWVIDCPFAGLKYETKIESITSEIDKETKTLRIRTQIDNLANKIKADMLVNGVIEIPPPRDSKRLVIPRLAMVSADGGDYAMVRIPGESRADAPMRFERRRLRVIYERSDRVYIAEGTQPGEGLKEGELVASGGSLLLMQMVEEGESQ